LAALREQAAREDALPEPLSWNGVLAESERRRGTSMIELPEKPICQQTEVHVVSLHALRDRTPT